MQCSIWLSSLTFPVKLNWNHKYWKAWICEYTKQKIMTKKWVSCPDWWTEFDEETLYKVTSDDLREKYEDFQRQIMVDKNPHLHWCPQVDWDRFVYAIPDHKGKKTKAKCEWGHEFWIECHEPWHPKKNWSTLK